MTNPINDMMRWFAYDHLPEHLQAISAPFHDLARQVADRALHAGGWKADSDETIVALRKLLEAKAAAVRAAL